MSKIDTIMESTAQFLADRLTKTKDGAEEVKTPTLIDGFKALTAYYEAAKKVTKTAKPDKNSPDPNGFEGMQQRIAAASNGEGKMQ